MHYIGARQDGRARLRLEVDSAELQRNKQSTYRLCLKRFLKKTKGLILVQYFAKKKDP